MFYNTLIFTSYIYTYSVYERLYLNIEILDITLARAILTDAELDEFINRLLNCNDNFLATYRKSRVSPTIIYTLTRDQFVAKKSLSVDIVVLVLRDIYNQFAKIYSELI